MYIAVRYPFIIIVVVVIIIILLLFYLFYFFKLGVGGRGVVVVF